MKGTRTLFGYPSLPAGELERFLIDRIRETVRDPQLLTNVIGRAQAQLDRQIAELKGQRQRRENHARRVNESICELTRVPEAPGVADELANLQEELVKAEKAVVLINRQIVELERRKIAEDELTGAFEAFEPMWDQLRPAEKTRLIHLLVQCIEYDGEGEQIFITYHPGGLKEFAEAEATHA